MIGSTSWSSYLTNEYRLRPNYERKKDFLLMYVNINLQVILRENLGCSFLS